MKKTAVMLFAAILLPVMLAAAELGPDVAVYRGQELKWENGQYDYLVLFKSQLANLTTANDTYNGNYCPLPDTCRESASAQLSEWSLPWEAQIKRVFLAWSAAQPTTKMDDLTDNAVRLEFMHESVAEMNTGIDVVGREARLTDPQDFEFESFVETVGDTKLGYSVHRVDVTDFFSSLMETGNELGIVDPAASLFGIYTVSGLECTEDRAYRNHAAMLADWSLIFIYNSQMVSPRQIYIYNGFHPYRHERVERKLAGFTFPLETEVKMTVMTHGGHTGMFDLTKSRVPESLELAGSDGAFMPLWNDCNPFMVTSEGRDALLYIDVFNSNSSLYPWGASQEFCTGGVPPSLEGSAEYAVDMDSFYLDGTEYPWDRVLQCGEQELTLAVSANENRVFTDMVILSHRAPNPPSAEFYKRACSSFPEENTFCYDTRAPFVYAFSFEAFSTLDISKMLLTDELPAEVEYVAGSTELATTFPDPGLAKWGWYASSWVAIPDGAGGVFPLAEGFPIGELLPVVEYCSRKEQRFIVRFAVRPKAGLDENTVIQNMGRLDREDGWMYSNTSIPLELHGRACAGAGYDVIDLTECGGGKMEVECSEYHPCPVGYTCDPSEKKCVLDPPAWCESVAVSSDKPDTGSAPMIIPAGTKDLVVGRFRLKGENCVLSQKHFGFRALRENVEKDYYAQLTDIELIHDENDNGKVDPNEAVLDIVEASGDVAAYFILDKDKNIFVGDEEHSFLTRVDVGDDSSRVSGSPDFRFVIEDSYAFAFDTVGTVTLEREPMNFDRFEIEPSNPYYFIVTRGLNDPLVPEDVRQDIPLLQLRAKSPDGPDKIWRIIVSTAGEEYVTFGEGGIRALSLYLDTNGDGVPDGEPIATVSKFDDPTEAVFEGEAIDSQLTFEQGEERFLIIKGDLTDMSCGKTARLAIKRGDVVVMDRSRPLFGLPVYSKEFGDLDEVCTMPKPDGCSCSLVF